MKFCINSGVRLFLSTMTLALVTTSALESNDPGNPQSLSSSICGSRNDGRSSCDVELDVPTLCAEASSSTCPIVLFLHGAGGGNTGFKKNSGVHDEGVIGVYPQGENGWNTGPKSSNSCHWSNLSCTTDPDEGDFIAAIIAELRNQGANGNIYVIGSSNGAALAHRLAANAGNELPIKGIVVKITQLLASPEQSGPGILNFNKPSLSTDRTTPPVSILSVMGTADGLIPYEGGSSSVFGGESEFQLMPALDSMEFWATHNGCSGAKNPSISSHNSDIGTGTAVKYKYSGCPDGIVVEHYAVEGGEHSNTGRAIIDGEAVDYVMAYDFIRRVEKSIPSDPAAPFAAPVAAPVVSPTFPDSPCFNDLNWAGKFNAVHTCDFVAQNPANRCFFENMDGIRAEEACPEACNSDCNDAPVAAPIAAPISAPVESPVASPTTEDSSCSNDPSWAGKFNAAHTCDFVSDNPDNRCFFENTDGVSAKDACPGVCHPDCVENSEINVRRGLRRRRI